jgi:hypothetical protein
MLSKRIPYCHSTSVVVIRSLYRPTFSANDIGNSGMIEIASAIKQNHTIHTLNLSGAHLSFQFIINFAGTNMGPEGTIAIAEAITGNKSIQMLDLSCKPDYNFYLFLRTVPRESY